MKYKDIRKFSYKTERRIVNSKYFDMDNWLSNPYSCLKTRFYIEGASILVFFLQKTFIKPNWISFFYAFVGILGGVCLSIKNDNIILFGLIIFFAKVAIDGADGLLARVKYKATNLGSIIDNWGGTIGEFSFLIGFGLYLYNFTDQTIYIYLTFLIIFLKSNDLKNYFFYSVAFSIYKQEPFIKEKSIQKKSRSNKIKKKYNLIKFFIQDIINYHAKTMDIILLIILIEININKITFSFLFFYLFLLREILIFLGGIYIINNKNLTSNILKQKVKYKN